MPKARPGTRNPQVLVYLDEPLLRALDDLVAESGARGRSELIRRILSDAIVEHQRAELATLRLLSAASEVAGNG